MSTQTIYNNSPIKTCDNCVYQKRECYHNECMRTAFLCSSMRQFPTSACDHNFSGWRPKPPRRSLRQWLYDLLLK